MNKFITIYELLGLIKDDKAPKSIIYKNEYFKYSKENRDYIGENNYLFSDFADLISILNDKVEILEEDKPIIEKLKVKDNKVIGKWKNGSDYRYTLSAPQVVIINKLNEVIDYLNKKEG